MNIIAPKIIWQKTDESGYFWGEKGNGGRKGRLREG